MRIVVCIKFVPDADAPLAAFSVEDADKVTVAEYVPLVVGPYDESAIEAALQLKEKYGGEVILLCFGSAEHREKMNEALGTGADRAVLIADNVNGKGDSFFAARVLSEAILRIGQVDLVLCGRQASDTDSGIVGPALAALLNFACAAIVKNIEYDGEKVVAVQQTDTGCRSLEVTLPAVLSVTSEKYTLRYASLAGIMAAMEKEVEVWELNGGAANKEYVLTRRRKAEVIVLNAKCNFITGNDNEELIGKLFAELRKTNGLSIPV